jgi:hypothetical protein
MNSTLLKIITLVLSFSLVSIAHADNDTNERGQLGQARTSMTGSQLECMRLAVSSRESAIRSAYSTLSSSYITALDARAKALDSAWNLTDKSARKMARETAWSLWNSTAKSAREAFKVSRKSAWETYRTSAKACKVPSTEVESSSTQMLDIQ